MSESVNANNSTAPVGSNSGSLDTTGSIPPGHPETILILRDRNGLFQDVSLLYPHAHVAEEAVVSSSSHKTHNEMISDPGRSLSWVRNLAGKGGSAPENSCYETEPPPHYVVSAL